MNEPVKFPYDVKQNIIVFGGHETWSKSIKQLLPKVKFVPRTQKPDVNSIKNRDRVWIQSNSISHSNFYTIINAAKIYNVPISYFGYASWKKCAMQIALSDKEVS